MSNPTVLGEICTLQGGYAFKSTDFSEIGVPVIKIADVTGGSSMNYSSMQCVAPEIASKAFRFKTEVGDTLISMTGANVGKATRVWALDPEAVINQRVGRFIPKYPERYPKDFIHYLVTNFEAYEFFKNTAYGSAQPNISGKQIESLPIPDLSSGEAIQIGAILGALDDKIEVNRKASATLEAMARALYRSWFVDFDPVWAKLENRPPAHMDPTTAALFPDSFDDDGLPLGWSFGTISDVAVKVQNGGTPSRSNPSFWDDGAIPWLTSGEVRQSMIINTAAKITELGMQNSSAKTVPTGATLVALYGATAGQVSRTAVQLTTNQAICAVITKNGFENVVFLALQDGIATLADRATGSAQQNISKGIVEAFEMIIPPNRIADEFQRQSEPLFNSVAALLLQNQTLATLRDSLLPRLMSGELRVDDARPQVEEVA